MSFALRIGNVLIPIVDAIEVSGTRPSGTIAIPGTAYDHFSYGTFLGNGNYPQSPGNVEHDMSATIMVDSLLVLHDDVRIHFDIVEDSKAAPSILITTSCEQNGVPKSLNPALVNMQICPGINTRPYNNEFHEAHMCAYKYRWPAASGTEAVWGYVLCFVRRYQTIPRDQQYVDRTTYNEQFLWINCPFFNRSYGWDTWLEEEEIPDPPSPDEPPFDPTEDPEPYNPTIDDTSDLVNIPGNPLIGVTSAGFINVYNPAMGALQGLGDILFPNVASATDIVEAVIKLCETLANQNLINYVIDCHVIPVQPQIGNNANIKVGFRDTGISVPVVTNDYIDATCGSLNIREYFGGFQDFLATRSKLYLPFVGFVDVRPEFWQGGTLSVDYKFNVIDGSFMCYVRSVSSKSQLNGSVIAQYAGNACVHFPLTGVNYSQMVSGIVGAAVTMASGGGSTAVLGGALSAANTIAAGGNVQQSNGYSSTAALMGVRTPYLLIERAVPAYSAKYAHDKGFPTNIATLISNVTGYTEISDIDLTGLPFTADELNELRQLLAEGVYF